MEAAPLKLLIVEDSPEDVESYRSLLAADLVQPCRVLTAGDGKEGLAISRAERPDCVLLDFSLPDMDGLEFIGSLEAALGGSAPAIVIVTGRGNETIAVSVMKAGAHDYLVKGEMTPQSLSRAIRYAIGHKAAEDRLRESEGRFRAITENTTDLTCILTADLSYAYVSPSVCRFSGFDSGQIVGREAEMLVHPGDAKAFKENILRAQRHPGTSVTIEDHRVHGPNFGWTYFSGRATGMSDVYGVNGVVIHCEDVTHRRQQEEIIRRQAAFDELTGLPNRTLFRDRLSRAVSSAIRNGTRAALMFADIDEFKNVNDTLGHTAGDELLKQAALRLKSCVRDVDTVARLGGDEFTFVLPDIQRAVDAEVVAAKVLGALATPFDLDGTTAFVSTSIGITLFPDDATDEESLLRNADTAMYRAKAEGRNRFRFFTPRMHTEAVERMRLDMDLGGAVDRGEFLLHFQPIVDLRTGVAAGAEALVRWQHPLRGLIAPGVFIPRAEDTGLIVPIGAWALETACRQLKRWHDAGHGGLTMSVNISARQCHEPSFEETVRRILDNTGVSPNSVTLEITESLFIGEGRRELSDAAALFNRLRAMGLSVALDDFGTGYSSLSYLKRFPVDILKIDRSFVQDVATDAEDMTLVDAIIAMAHGLNIAVVAEGMETEEQTRVLLSRDCDRGQGYYFSRPMPGEQFAPFLEGERTWLVPGGDGAGTPRWATPAPDERPPGRPEAAAPRAAPQSSRGMSSVGVQRAV